MQHVTRLCAIAASDYRRLEEDSRCARMRSKRDLPIYACACSRHLFHARSRSLGPSAHRSAMFGRCQCRVRRFGCMPRSYAARHCRAACGMVRVCSYLARVDAADTPPLSDAPAAAAAAESESSAPAADLVDPPAVGAVTGDASASAAHDLPPQQRHAERLSSCDDSPEAPAAEEAEAATHRAAAAEAAKKQADSERSGSAADTGFFRRSDQLGRNNRKAHLVS
jgi:hypothetical protein